MGAVLHRLGTVLGRIRRSAAVQTRSFMGISLIVEGMAALDHFHQLATY